MFSDVIVTTAGGDRIAVRDFGRHGPPIVLLHGAGLNLAMWDGLASRIAELYHLVALDFLGHGESVASGARSVGGDLAAIATVIDELGLVRPVLVGHSYGGLLAVLYASTHADCRQVVNLDGLAGGRARSDHYLDQPAQSVATFWSTYLAQLRTMVPPTDSGDDAWLQAEYAQAESAQEPGVDPEILAGLLERTYGRSGNGTWERRPTGSALLAMIEALGHVDIFGAYREVSCPVTLVLARPQRGLPEALEGFLVSYFRAFARAFPSLGDYLPERRLFTVDSGHGFPIEDPDALADLLRRLVPSS